MNAGALRLLDVVLRSSQSVANNDPLSLMQEGGVKSHLMRALVDSGATVREGSPRTNEDWLIRTNRGVLSAALVSRIGTGDTKSDIRIEHPQRVAFELKVYPEIGSKDTFNRGEIVGPKGNEKNPNSFLWDLKAVKDGRAQAAVCICGARQYDTARGDVWDNRGRNAGVVLSGLLPQRQSLSPAFRDFSGRWWDVPWTIRAALANTPRLSEVAMNGSDRRRAEARVVVALWIAR